MLRKRSEYEIALMLLMVTLPELKGVGNVIQNQFEKIYHDQIPPEDFVDLPSGVSRWRKEVQWSRYQLVKKGLMDAPQTGIWRLTEKGRQWLNDQQEIVQTVRNDAETINENVSLLPTVSDKQASTQQEPNEDFLITLKESLLGSLPSLFGHVPIEFVRRSNYLQIRLGDFPGCHYEIILRRSKHEIALHFESSAERSQARLRGFEPHIEEISQSIEMPVHAGNFQSRGWTQVYIEMQAQPLVPGVVKEYTDIILRYITATFPILQKIYSNEGGGYRSAIGKEKRAEDPHLHKILDQEVEVIEAYLQGRSSIQISDEKLCEWVNFCYTFEMYKHAINLFSLIGQGEVNPWYYERTKKIVKACEQKVKVLEMRAG
jgi:hypothetical protein